MTEVERLLQILPPDISATKELFEGDDDRLLEIVVDLGRPVELRYPDRIVKLETVVTEPILAACLAALPRFGKNNRAGLNGTIHRISRILDRFQEPVGLTYRVGRPFEGCVEILRDLIEAGQSILLLGKPGIGKTTKLRDIARHLSTEVGLRTVIVDTSNEIAGDGTVPHASVGDARRMQVPLERTQAEVMREAVENHMPQVIVVDEISDAAETEAARTIAYRGVQLVATAHGQVIQDLLQPPLNALLGGVTAVTRGDRFARQNGGRKTALERQAPPVFDVVVELHSFDEVVVYTNPVEIIDVALKGGEVRGERRRLVNGKVTVVEQRKVKLPEAAPVTVGDRVQHSTQQHKGGHHGKKK